MNPENNNRRKTYLIAGLIIVLVIIGAALALRGSPKKNQTGGERGPLTFQNSLALSSILLQKQYNYLTSDLSLFITNQIAQNASGVSISNVGIASNGDVSFQVNIKAPVQKSFKETVDRSVFNQITVSIPQYNYKKTISVY